MKNINQKNAFKWSRLFFFSFFGLWGFLPTIGGATTTISSIDFMGLTPPHQIAIKADGPLTYSKQENTNDQQIILEISNAKLAKTASRKIDTSSFDSPVTLISPYMAKETPDLARIVVQLRQNAAVDVRSEGNSIILSLNQNAATETESPPSSASNNSTPTLQESNSPSNSSSGASTSENAALEKFMETQISKQFIGRPITLHLRDVPTKDVFRFIGEASGFNIVLGEEVKGKVTLALTDTPWDQALDLILRTQKLGAERSGNILRITTLKNLTEEKTEELKAKQATLASTPRITKVFNINYSNLKQLSDLVEQFSSKSTQAGGDPSLNSIVKVDERTNSIVVRDTQENIDKIQKLIEILDTQTPQVLVESKVIEATENFSKSMGGSIGVSDFDPLNTTGTNATPQLAAGGSGSLGMANPIDPLAGSPGIFGKDLQSFGKEFASFSKGSGGIAGTLPFMGFVGNTARLNAVLNIAEQENEVRVVTAPKSVVLNKHTSKISQTIPVMLPAVVVSANGSTTTTYPTADANIGLEVQPTITNDNSVALQLKVSRDVPIPVPNSGASLISKRNIDTNVIVESGSTLVIGGIFNNSSSKASTGFPFLRKIPIIGLLFGSEIFQNDKTELFIFVTPRILNIKEAGLATGST